MRPGPRPARVSVAAAVVALILAAFAALGPATAQDDAAAALERWGASVEGAQAALSGDVPDEALRAARERLEADRSAARASLSAQRERVEQLRRQLEALGPAPQEGQAEDDPVAELRRSLGADIVREEGRAGAIQLAETRLTQALDALSAAGRERLRTRLLTRGALPVDPATWLAAGSDATRASAALAAETARRLADPILRAAAFERAPEAAVALIGGAALLVLARRRIDHWTREAARAPGLSRGALVGVGAAATLARLVIPLLALVLLGFAATASGLLGPIGTALLEGLGRGLAWVVAAYALAEAYLAPDAPALRLSGLDDKGARRARWAVMTLAWVVAADAAVDAVFEAARLDERSFVALNFALVSVGGVAFWRLKRVYERRAGNEPEAAADPGSLPAIDAEEDSRTLERQLGWLLRRAAALTALAAPLLSALGYYAASRELMLPAAKTALLLGAAALAQALARETAGAALGSGRPARVLPILSGAALLALGLPLLAVIWGAEWSDIADVWRLAVEGFSVGAMTFRPLDAAFFAAVFALGYALTRLVQRVLRVSILPQMGVTEGSQSALTSGVGYIGVLVAGLVAISATGLDLSNLAIVAGALSVGVGFGLQTIVNNFVSGIILLVERPIKVGDWIEANGVHGYVKKVNVRSTMIETFDLSTYIVPNSQLVAQPVTNFTHTNLVGRLIVPVRVTRDADVRVVERILLEVAQRHPMVLRRPAPLALFFEFARDGAFDFELRVILRDVNLRLSVGSEIRFAIAERFRAAGIEFAAPRQEVTVRGREGGLADDPEAEAAAAAAQPQSATAAPPRAAAAGRV